MLIDKGATLYFEDTYYKHEDQENETITIPESDLEEIDAYARKRKTVSFSFPARSSETIRMSSEARVE